MLTINDLLMIISSIGVINSLFVILYLVFSSRGDKRLNLLLAMLVAGFTIRIGKSVVFYFSDHLSTVIINMGFAGFLTIGPFLYLYFKALWKNASQIGFRQLLHFVPAAIALSLCWLIPYYPQSKYWQAGYLFIILQIFSYILLTGFVFFKSYPDKESQKNTWLMKVRWSTYLLGSILLVWLAYFLHFPLRLGSYINGAVFYSLIIYVVIYKWARMNKGRYSVKDKKKYLE